jgi:hypothetical protein
MNTHDTHHTPTHHTPTAGPGKEVALRWLAGQLRWERLLADLRNPATRDEEEAAA